MFRRRKADPTSEIDELEAESLELAEPSEQLSAEPPVTFDRSNGPWDVSELPETDELTRLDLGSLQVAAYEGMELRLDIDEASSVVQAVTVVARQVDLALDNKAPGAFAHHVHRVCQKHRLAQVVRDQDHVETL